MKTVSTILLGALLMSSNLPAAEPVHAMTAATRARLDAELRAVVESPTHPLVSLSVLAMKDGKIVYHQQFGHRWLDLDKPASSVAADANTMYRVASISKLITTLGVMKLVEEGKLSLDADVGDYLGYPLRNPHFPNVPITLRMMMSHTSSLRDDGGYYWEAKLGVNLKEVLVPGGKLYGKGEMWSPKAKPGAYFQYANFPWGIIGTIMERVTAERFDRLMRRLVLDPLGVKGGFHPADFSKEDLANVATLYRKRIEVDGKEIWKPMGPWVAQVDDYHRAPPTVRALPDYVPGTNGTLFGPQGNCRLSAAGLARVMQMLMNGGEIDSKVILKRDSVEKILAMQWLHDGRGRNGDSNGEPGYGIHADRMNAWGLGVQHFLDLTGPNRGDRLVEPGGFKASGHMGDAWGLTSIMAFDRSTKTGLIFLTGGPGFDPETYPGSYSAMYRHEEQILTALYRRAIQQDAR